MSMTFFFCFFPFSRADFCHGVAILLNHLSRFVFNCETGGKKQNKPREKCECVRALFPFANEDVTHRQTSHHC